LTSTCSNCYVTGIQIDMEFADGRSANMDSGIMLHHLVLIQPGLPDATCGPSTLLGVLGQRFFASGNERTPGVLPAGFGYHLGSGPLLAVFDIMNMSSSLQVVWLAATVSWLPDTTPGIKPVTPVWLDENNCSTSTYAIPAGPTDRVWTWTSTITGRVVTAGGHVHDGGVETELADRTNGQHICTSRAGYGTKPAYMGSVESMTTCSHDRIGMVRAGDVLALDTYYNSPTAKTDVMGIMIAYVYQTNDVHGGTEDAADKSPATPPGAPAGRKAAAPSRRTTGVRHKSTTRTWVSSRSPLSRRSAGGTPPSCLSNRGPPGPKLRASRDLSIDLSPLREVIKARNRY